MTVVWNMYTMLLFTKGSTCHLGTVAGHRVLTAAVRLLKAFKCFRARRLIGLCKALFETKFSSEILMLFVIL